MRRPVALAVAGLMASSIALAPPASASSIWDCTISPLYVHNSSTNPGTIGGGVKVSCTTTQASIKTLARLQYYSGGTWKDVSGSTVSSTKTNVKGNQASVHACPPQSAPVRVRIESEIRDSEGRFLGKYSWTPQKQATRRSDGTCSV